MRGSGWKIQINGEYNGMAYVISWQILYELQGYHAGSSYQVVLQLSC